MNILLNYDLNARDLADKYGRQLALKPPPYD